ncbi:MAG TPA: LysR family transcriptional regulator [Pseudomonadales bacterium]
MDTQNLRAFLAVADSGSFSEAAIRLHLTQPAVSKRIAVLETELDTRLFDRIGRSVQLTESGRTLLPRARAILLDIEDARRSLHNLTDEVSGTLSIGTSHHAGLHRLPPALRHFARAHPQVALDIRFMDSEQAHEAVLHGELELAIVTLSPIDIAQLKRTVLWHDPLAFACAPDHPLAATPAPTPKQLIEWPSVLPGEATYTGRLIREAFEAQQLTLPVAMTTNYLETLKMLAGVGLGWSVLPQTMLDDELIELKPQGMAISRELGLIVHRERSLSNAAQRFIDALHTNTSKDR